MDINAANIRALNQASTATFTRTYDGYEAIHPRLAMKTPAPAGFVIYSWLGAMPAMKKWEGKLEKQSIASNNYQVNNEAYSMSWEIPRLDITRDRFGVYGPMFAMAGQNAALHPDILLAELINGGFSKKCYTGKNFFDTDHLHVKGVQAGKFTNTSTKKLTGDYFDLGRAALLNIKDPAGIPFNIGAKLALICGEELRGAGEQLLHARDIGGTTNVRYQTAELIVNPLITGTTWAIVNLGSPAKPFVFQEEEKTRFVARTNPDSPSIFERETFDYKAFGVYTMNYGLPQMAYGSTGVDA